MSEQMNRRQFLRNVGVLFLGLPSGLGRLARTSNQEPPTPTSPSIETITSLPEIETPSTDTFLQLFIAASHQLRDLNSVYRLEDRSLEAIRREAQGWFDTLAPSFEATGYPTATQDNPRNQFQFVLSPSTRFSGNVVSENGSCNGGVLYISDRHFSEYPDGNEDRPKGSIGLPTPPKTELTDGDHQAVASYVHELMHIFHKEACAAAAASTTVEEMALYEAMTQVGVLEVLAHAIQAHDHVKPILYSQLKNMSLHPAINNGAGDMSLAQIKNQLSGYLSPRELEWIDFNAGFETELHDLSSRYYTLPLHLILHAIKHNQSKLSIAQPSLTQSIESISGVIQDLCPNLR